MSIKESRLVNKIWKAQHLVLYKLGWRNYRRAHKPIIRKCLREVFKTTSHPTVIETGCIRDVDEGTESTLTISSTLNSRGTFYTFEICKEHIRICQSLCRDYNEYINYVEGDAIENLRKMVDVNVLDTIHLALFDSVNDGDHIWKEFKTCEKVSERTLSLLLMMSCGGTRVGSLSRTWKHRRNGKQESIMWNTESLSPKRNEDCERTCDKPL